MIIVTHTSPDWDAIGAVWLLMRYGGMEGAEIRFVNTGNPDSVVLAAADVVVDTGKEHDPARLRFDHHHFPGSTANDTCAMDLVRDHLFGDAAHYLDPLVMLIWAGDTGRKTHGADWSHITGIHALLSVRKSRKAGDLALLAWGLDVLDDLAEHLKVRQEAHDTLLKHTVYRSDDGRVIALDNAPNGHAATQAAFEAGAQVVVFRSDYPDVPTISVGAQRAPESGIDIGALVLAAIHAGGDVIVDELVRWYHHPSGFYAGRGSSKAPSTVPLTMPLATIARVLDEARRIPA